MQWLKPSLSTNKMLDSVLLFTSVILTASEEQLQHKTGATGGGIKTWTGLWRRSNWVSVSSGTLSFVLWLGDTWGEGSLFCLYI